MNFNFNEDFFETQLDDSTDIVNVELWNVHQQKDIFIGHGSFTIYKFQKNNGIVDVDLFQERKNAGNITFEGSIDQRRQ